MPDKRYGFYPNLPPTAPSAPFHIITPGSSNPPFNIQTPYPPHHQPQYPHHHQPPYPQQPPNFPHQPPTHFPNQPPTHFPHQPPTHFPQQPPHFPHLQPHTPNLPVPHHHQQHHHHHSHANKPGFYWVHSSTYSGVPSGAVRGGSDCDGTPIYVGRAYHEGDYIPAKVMPDKHAAYVAFGGDEHHKDTYEVLCEQRFEWVCCSGGNIPHNAVDGGRTSDGETLYVGRCFHDGSQTVGKVHPSHGCLYIPYGGQELKYHDYEILILL